MLIVCFSGFAELINETEANSIASSFFTNKGKQSSTKSIKSPSIKLAYTSRDKVENIPYYYVYNNTSKNGYVIVSGDNNTSSNILGYSDHGAFNYDSIPANMRQWLNQYESEIEFIRANDDIASPATPKPQQTSASLVKPLLKSKWGQGTPYNNLCPIVTYSNGQKDNAASGCVATALAQIMYYHRWPLQGTGFNTYTTKIDSVDTMLSADFSQSVYDWDNMLPTYKNTEYSETNANAVAKLMSDVGIATNMAYGEESGSNSYQANKALVYNFGYDKSMQSLDRINYSQTDWEQMMRNELDQARPIYYSGRSDYGGHAFVCDGYDNGGFFHIDWGWSGNYNGYFLTTALTTNYQNVGSSGYGYNYRQNMIIGIKQAEENSVENITMSAESMYAEKDEYTLGSTVAINLTSYFGNHIHDISMLNSIHFIDSNGNSVYHFESKVVNLKVNYGWNTLSFRFLLSRSFPEGTYKVVPRWRLEGESEYRDVILPFYHPKHLEMRVEGGKAYFAFPEGLTPNLTMSNINADKAVAGYKLRARATVTNTGDCEYYGDVYMAIMDGEEIISTSEKHLVDLETNESVTFEREFTAPESAGIYKIAVLDEDGNIISGEALTIYVSEAEEDPRMSITKALSAPQEMSPDNIYATAELTNYGGYFAGDIQLMICNAEGTKIYSLISQYATFEKGETITIEFNGTFNGTIGESYRIYLRYPLDLSKYYIWGDPVMFTLIEGKSGISEVNGNIDRIYPNPATDYTTIECSSPIERVMLYSLTGAEVLNVTGGNSHSVTIDISDLSNGHYIVKVLTSNGKLKSHQLIKK